MASAMDYPLLFEPYLRPMPWGGDRLAKWVSRALPKEPIGEAWVLSGHPLHVSRVANGPLAGRNLHELLEANGQDLIGFNSSRFPLLIKLLDACENLSVQVHPDDLDAKRLAPGEGGKTEAWLVLEADADVAIYLGLKPGIDKAAYSELLAQGKAIEGLRRFKPKPGECYFLPAGVVHALGGGLVVLEVQQTSDATFRLYDWGRTDAAGKPRALHLNEGLACIKENVAEAGLQQSLDVGGNIERLVECPYFTMNRIRLKQPVALQGPCILIGLESECDVVGGGQNVRLTPGGAMLIPASLPKCELQPLGRAVVVQVLFGGGG